MGEGSGFGKVILFGEHFVVHGIPGIVSAIDSTNEAIVKRTGTETVVKDERKTAKGYSQEKQKQQLESIDRMLKAMGVEEQRVQLVWASAAEGQQLAEAIDKLVADVKALGPLGWSKNWAENGDRIKALEDIVNEHNEALEVPR